MVISGFLLIDKPMGLTSHDVVARVRKALGQRRVGHSGTLDPSATGLLLVATGRATRLIRFLDVLAKSYTCRMVLGTTTSTLDADGEVTATYNMEAVTREHVAHVATRFVGDGTQVPPMVSALKVNGKRLYDLAREGVEVERKPRHVTIHRLEVASTDSPLEYLVTVTCSTGTYVRSLVADLGEALGGGAHLCDLRRTTIGPYDVKQALSLDALAADGASAVVAPGHFLTHLPRRTLSEEGAQRVRTGRTIKAEEDFAPAETDEQGDEGLTGSLALLDAKGELLAVYARQQPLSEWRAEVVLV